MIEYPNGVRKPQVDAPEQDKNAESVTTIFWPNGNRMCRTPAIGMVPNGQDRLWWPNGQLAREAHFLMNVPEGVWKFFDTEGNSVGEGSFKHGKRQSGVFIGSDGSSSNFFVAAFPMKKQRFEDGTLVEETDFLKELPDFSSDDS